MAKLERVTAKVFASDAPADKIGQFGSALAGTKLETGDVSTIQALPAYTEGWSSAVISQRNYPVLQETNGVMKNMSYQTAYIMQNGIAEYDPDTEYYAGSICKGIGNANQYASLGDENVGNAVTDSDYWKNITPVNYSNITNCITEIPQRIKLELNNGVLTLKAGSEVIVPNGFEADGTTPKFDYETVESDISLTGGTTGTRIGFYSKNAQTFLGVINTYVYSGDTAKMNSTSALTYGRFYNTQTNKIYVGNSNGGSWVEAGKTALPICIFRCNENNTVEYLDQVFNGMGYIDSYVWVDKDVKGLIPNGRNEDGSLRNVEYTHNRLEITSRSVTGYNPVIIGNTRPLTIGTQPYTESATPLPASGSGFSIYLNTYENIFYINNGSAWIASECFLVATASVTSGVINSLQAKQPFSAADSSDCDGVWTGKELVLINNVKLPNSGTISYSLDDYLPKDNNIYEVIISCAGYFDKGQYNFNTGFYTMYGPYMVGKQVQSCFTTPVSQNRVLYLLPTTLCSGDNELSIRVTAYRKVR